MRVASLTTFTFTLCATLLLGATTLAASLAEARAITHNLNIPAQDLGTALKALGAAANEQVLFSDDVVAGLQSPQVKGKYSTDQAVTLLLKGTSLQVDRTPSGVLLIRSHGSSASIKVNSTSLSTLGERRSAASPLPLQGREDQSVVAPSEGEKKSFWSRLRLAQAETSSQSGVEGRGESSSEGQTIQQLEEIIVTAQKRVERLVDVPIAISVLGGEQLDSSTAEGITESMRNVPGVTTTVAAQGGGTQISMRGVSADAPLFAGASTTAYYLDSVPFGLSTSSIVPDTNVYDLERVEVLRGPQGTLYGAGSLNGVVRVLTKQPNLSRFELKARSSISATQYGGESTRADASVNVPLVTDKVGVRAVVGYQSLGGWIDRPNRGRNDANDADILSMRLKMDAKATDNLSIGLSAWQSRADYGAPSFSPDNRQIGSSVEEPMTSDYNLYGATIGYAFPAFSVTSATGFLEYVNDSYFVSGASRQRTLYEADTFSQEINLNSTHDGPWRWSFGGIYRDSDDRLLADIPGVLISPIDNTRMSDSFAVFGELTRIFLNGQWELTGGLRYFEDRLTTREDSALAFAPPIPTPGGVYARAKFDALSPRVVLTWHPTDESTIYTSYSEGFRSGASQNRAAVLRGIPHTEPDDLTNYEVGAKGNLLGGRLNVDSSIYFIDWENVQQSLGVPIGTVFLSALVNSESASGVGFDLGATAELTDGLTVSGSVSWNDLKFDSDVVTFTSTGVPVTLFSKGDRLNFSPKTTLASSIDYAFSLGNNYEGRLSASGTYTPGQYSRRLQGTVVDVSVGDPMFIGRAGFTVDAPNNWSASLYVDNVTNEQGAFINNWFGVADRDVRTRPRTFGLQVEFRM